MLVEGDELRAVRDRLAQHLGVLEPLSSAEIEQHLEQVEAGLQVLGVHDVGIGHELVEGGGLGQHRALAVDDVGTHDLLGLLGAATLLGFDVPAQLIRGHDLPVAQPQAGRRTDDGEDEQDGHHAQAAVGTAQGWHIRVQSGRADRPAA